MEPMPPTQTPIADYVRRMEAYKNTPFKIRGSESFYIGKDGEEIPAKEWEAANPIPIYIQRKFEKGDNPDRRMAWLID